MDTREALNTMLRVTGGKALSMERDNYSDSDYDVMENFLTVTQALLTADYEGDLSVLKGVDAPWCPQSVIEFIEGVQEMPEPIQKCGCGGEIKQGVGCLAYSGGDEHVQDAQHEDYMRMGGLGFAAHYDSFVATMSMHLQSNGLSFEEAVALLDKEGQ